MRGFGIRHAPYRHFRACRQYCAQQTKQEGRGERVGIRPHHQRNTCEANQAGKQVAFFEFVAKPEIGYHRNPDGRGLRQQCHFTERQHTEAVEVQIHRGDAGGRTQKVKAQLVELKDKFAAGQQIGQ